MIEFMIWIIAFLAVSTHAQLDDTEANSIIGIYSARSTVITARCAGENAQYTTWDGTVGCRWFPIPTSGQLTTTSVSRGMSCTTLPPLILRAAPTTAAVVSFAQGDSLRLFASVTTKTIACSAAGCGTLRVWDFNDGPTPVSGEMAVLVTCLDDLALPSEARDAVLYRNAKLATSVFSGLREPSQSSNTSITSPLGTTPEIPISSSTAMSSGALVGIIIGSIASLALAASLFVLSIRQYRKRHGDNCDTNETHPDQLLLNSILNNGKSATGDFQIVASLSELATPKPSWNLWRKIKNAEYPQELPENTIQAELPASTTLPSELDGSCCVVPQPAEPELARPLARERESQMQSVRSDGMNARMRGAVDDSPIHPYNFYSPWNVRQCIEDSQYAANTAARVRTTRCSQEFGD
ncbi:hypothetical protein BROUX41_000894 [Berkeleyomyces rouxiae]|uniref:uncharacterized protein n=1 Tax=Berkeleyomyces rouxiae TaxID=2035830 RepID=UPI003B7D6F37